MDSIKDLKMRLYAISPHKNGQKLTTQGLQDPVRASGGQSRMICRQITR